MLSGSRLLGGTTTPGSVFSVSVSIAQGTGILRYPPRAAPSWPSSCKDPNGLSKRKDTGETGRFRKFHLSEIKERGYKLDVTWLKDDSLEDSDELPEPQDLAAEAITELEAVVDDLREIVALVEKEEGVEK